jgi:uncharacterized protein (DUF1684 family)
MSELKAFRKAKDEFFRNDPQSPLDHSQKVSFNGLKYYPESQELRFDLALEKAEEPEQIIMATSTGDEQEYIHAGQIRFPVQGQEAILQVYVSASGDDYFIPFVDATAPGETYGAGRYLEPHDLGAGRLHIDFNLAYNPYCAYNDRWSCPLPPSANRIKVRIEAGEKKFHK